MMQIGTGAQGAGVNRVRVTTVLGDRAGAVGGAWATAIASPSIGHSPLIVEAAPNLPVVPATLLVPAIGMSDRRHIELTMGASQAGIAAAVHDLQMDDPDGAHCVIASVWVDAAASDDAVVFENTRDAAMAALKQGAAGGPWHPNLVAVEHPSNDFYPRTAR